MDSEEGRDDREGGCDDRERGRDHRERGRDNRERVRDSRERRDEDRFETENSASLEFKIDGEVVHGGHVARTLDLSIAGAKVELAMARPLPLEVGGVVHLTLALGAELLKLLGRIAHVTGKGDTMTEIGIAFVDMGINELERISSFLVSWKETQGLSG